MHGRSWPERAPSTTWMLVAVALLGVLLLGALIRSIGIDWGRPFAYHPDEWLIFRPAMTMVQDRDWNPHAYWYSSLLIDLQAGVTAILRFAGGSSLDIRPGANVTELMPDQFRYLLGGRLLVLTFGVATIAIVFEIGRRLRGPAAGLIAAAILATMPLHISESRSLTTDVPVAMFTALALLLTVRAERDDGERWWLLAGLAAGLAASTKWNGVLVLAVPLFVFLTLDPTMRGVWARLRRRTAYLMVGSAGVALILTTPGVVLDTGTVLGFFRTQAAIYANQRIGIDEASLPRNLRGLAAGLGPIAIVVATLGGLRFLVRPRSRSELAMALFVIGTLIVVSLPARQFDRNMLPILPFLAVMAACFLADLPGMAGVWLSGERVSPRRLLAILAAGALLGCLVVGARAGVDSGLQNRVVDTRTVARNWLLAHVARNTKIGRERDTPVLLPSEYLLRTRYYLSERSLDWYRSSATQLLITSSNAYRQFVDNPATPEPAAFYSTLFSLPEVYRVDPSPGQPGPTIRIFQLAPFRTAGAAAGG